MFLWWSGLDCKESTCNAGDQGSIPGLGRSPGEGNGNPLQCSGLENPMDRGAWRATVDGVTESWQLRNFFFFFFRETFICSFQFWTWSKVSTAVGFLPSHGNRDRGAPSLEVIFQGGLSQVVGSTVPVTKLTKGFLSCFQKDVGTHFKERRKYLKL